jgi:hypothetical protein
MLSWPSIAVSHLPTEWRGRTAGCHGGGANRGRAAALLAAAAVASLMLLGCREPWPPRDLDDSFRRFQRALHDGDSGRVFDHLDLATKWSVASVHKYQREMHELVARDYPAPLRAAELARTALAARARDEREFFVLLADEDGRIDRLQQGRGSGAVQRRELSGDQTLLLTDDGGRYPFTRGSDGRWGYSGYAAEFAGRKDRAAQDVELVRENARIYRLGRGAAAHGQAGQGAAADGAPR